MAKLCAHCGNPLLRETSRFCNTCGASASSNAGSPSVPATPTPNPATPGPRHTKVIAGEQAQPVLREQIAFAQPLQTVPVELPAWMSKLDKMGDRPLPRASTPQSRHRLEPPHPTRLVRFRPQVPACLNASCVSRSGRRPRPAIFSRPTNNKTGTEKRKRKLPSRRLYHSRRLHHRPG